PGRRDRGRGAVGGRSRHPRAAAQATCRRRVDSGHAFVSAPSRASAPRLLGATLAERHPGIAASAGVFAAALLAFLAIGAALPVLPGYVRGPLRSGDVAVGIVVGAFALTAVVCRPLAGRQADVRGRRAVLIAGVPAMALSGVLYLTPTSLATLIVARLVVGAGEGAVYT